MKRGAEAAEMDPYAGGIGPTYAPYQYPPPQQQQYAPLQPQFVPHHQQQYAPQQQQQYAPPPPPQQQYVPQYAGHPGYGAPAGAYAPQHQQQYGASAGYGGGAGPWAPTVIELDGYGKHRTYSDKEPGHPAFKVNAYSVKGDKNAHVVYVMSVDPKDDAYFDNFVVINKYRKDANKVEHEDPTLAYVTTLGAGVRTYRAVHFAFPPDGAKFPHTASFGHVFSPNGVPAANSKPAFQITTGADPSPELGDYYRDVSVEEARAHMLSVLMRFVGKFIVYAAQDSGMSARIGLVGGTVVERAIYGAQNHVIRGPWDKDGGVTAKAQPFVALAKDEVLRYPIGMKTYTPSERAAIDAENLRKAAQEGLGGAVAPVNTCEIIYTSDEDEARTAYAMLGMAAEGEEIIRMGKGTPEIKERGIVIKAASKPQKYVPLRFVCKCDSDDGGCEMCAARVRFVDEVIPAGATIAMTVEPRWAEVDKKPYVAFGLLSFAIFAHRPPKRVFVERPVVDAYMHVPNVRDLEPLRIAGGADRKALPAPVPKGEDDDDAAASAAAAAAEAAAAARAKPRDVKGEPVADHPAPPPPGLPAPPPAEPSAPPKPAGTGDDAASGASVAPEKGGEEEEEEAAVA